MKSNEFISEAKRPVKQGAASDYPTPKRLNKGVDKIYAKVLQQQIDRENGEGTPPSAEQVAVMVDAHPGKLSYGIFKRVGRSGLFHIKLLGGKLKDWANGDEIAVSPHEVYATWDQKLQGNTAVHRAYNDDGSSAVREGPEEHFAKDPSGYTRNMHTNRLEGPHWSAVGDKPTGRYAKRLERYAKERAEREAKPESVKEASPNVDRESPKYHHAQANRLHAELGVNGYESRLADKLDHHQQQYKKLTGKDVDLSATSKKWGIRSESVVAEATGLKKRVKIVKGPAAGKTGYVGEVHNGLYKGAPKRFVIDLDGGGNINCSKDELRLIKEQ
jgi:hypothetical protein